jgi:hypothetical protein
VKAKEVVRNAVKERLARNEVVASISVRLTRGVEIARLAKSAGFDMIYVDLEHSTMTIEATGQICLAALGLALVPMVRVPANTPNISSVCWTAVRSALSRRASGRRMKRVRWSKRRNIRRLVSAAQAAPCRISSTARFRPPKPTPRSTTPPW